MLKALANLNAIDLILMTMLISISCTLLGPVLWRSLMALDSLEMLWKRFLLIGTCRFIKDLTLNVGDVG